VAAVAPVVFPLVQLLRDAAEADERHSVVRDTRHRAARQLKCLFQTRQAVLAVGEKMEAGGEVGQ
jgi:hypothetical protein